MFYVLKPGWDLFSGAAYRPHPADASLPLSRRFEGKQLILVGGGGTAVGWTQRVHCHRGEWAFREDRSSSIKRGSAEWSRHLAAQRARGDAWAIVLVEQQWQAAFARSCAASVGSEGVERMLRVRDAASEFGDDRMAEDAVRAAVDHPTMEGAVVVGVRTALLELLEKEVRDAGFAIAAVRVPTFALIEQHFAALARQRISPKRHLVAFDGQSALSLAIREGAFEPGEGGCSYVVNRNPAEVRGHIFRRVRALTNIAGDSAAFDLLGVGLEADATGEGQPIKFETHATNPIAACLSGSVLHDLRTDLRATRAAAPSIVRYAVFGAAAVFVCAVVSTILHLNAGWQLRGEIEAQRVEQSRQLVRSGAARSQIETLKKEETNAHQVAEWVGRNYHAQALVCRILGALPAEISLDSISVQAAEGLPQARLKFVMLGAEEAQRSALRAIEAELYQRGYVIGHRDDPVLATQRRGAVVYAWDLILPNFGS